MRRRALLSTVAAAVTTLGGCLDGHPPTPSAKTESRHASGAGVPARVSPGDSRANPSPRPVRCRGEPVSVQRSATDEPGYDDGIEYYPANGTVRFVAARRGDEPASFDTWSFEEWGSIRCAEAGVERVRAATADRLGTDEFGSGIGQPPGFDLSNGLVVRLNATATMTDEGTPKPPAVPLARLADAAPRSVDATASLDGESFSRTVPVFAERVEVGPARAPESEPMSAAFVTAHRRRRNR